MRRKFYFMVLVGALATLVPLGTVVGTAHASVYLGSNFLVAGKVNTISDVSYADKTPGSLSMGDVIFGYQWLSLGAVLVPGFRDHIRDRARARQHIH